MRVNKRWNQKQQPRSPEQMGNAVAAAIWKLASQALLNLENENFETTTQAQRLDILEELVVYLIHQCDRRIEKQTNSKNRAGFISAMAKDLARIIEDSRVDVQGAGNYQAEFLEKTNLRIAVYSNFRFSLDEGAGFTMRCALGDFVRDAMGARDNKWIPDYIIGREAPVAEIALKSTLSGLVSFSD